MNITDLEQLEYLHDAIVKEIAFAYTNSSKGLRISSICNGDCGYHDWNGKTVIVTLSQVTRASGVLLGHVAGRDMIQSFSEGASAEMKLNIDKLCSIGVVAPKVFLRLTLHSGSELEIACDEITVYVED